MDNITIENEWKDYREAMVPEEAMPEQVRQVKMAFYGGFGSLLLVCKNKIADMSDDDGVIVLERLHQEMIKFSDDCKHGRI